MNFAKAHGAASRLNSVASSSDGIEKKIKHILILSEGIISGEAGIGYKTAMDEYIKNVKEISELAKQISGSINSAIDEIKEEEREANEDRESSCSGGYNGGGNSNYGPGMYC